MKDMIFFNGEEDGIDGCVFVYIVMGFYVGNIFEFLYFSNVGFENIVFYFNLKKLEDIGMCFCFEFLVILLYDINYNLVDMNKYLCKFFE